MPQPAIPRPRPLPIRIAFLAIAATALLALPGAVAAQPTKRVAKEAGNATLNETILTVGTWHAAKVKKSSSAPPPESEPPPYP